MPGCCFFQPSTPVPGKAGDRGAACAECLIAQQRPEFSNNTQRPWCDTGDILCEGYICGRRLIAKRPYAGIP